jgi:GNAT superfamily N-acetyltransferase
MTSGDAAWAAGLMERRRQVYAAYSPVFWRPRPGVTGLHTRFLGRQIGSPGYLALRTGHGFLIGQRRGQEGFVDDFAVDEPASWDGDGAALLLAAWRRWAADGLEAVRVVTAHADEDKCAMLAALTLELAEQWWVRELSPGEHESQGGQVATPGPVTGTGFSGLLGPAPPVYDPGGPVLLVAELAAGADLAGADLAGVEREAAGMGAVLLIVPAAPASARAAAIARRPGWSVASDWYLGRPGARTRTPGGYQGGPR